MKKGIGLFKMERDKLRYSVSRTNIFVKLSAILMGLSALLRLIGYWGFWANKDTAFVYTQIALPVLCNVLFIIIVLYMGKRLFSLTFIPVLLGVVFFIIKALGFDSIIHTLLCILLYLLVAMLYTGTVFGVIRTKWLLVPLFGLPFLYHILVEDRNTLLANENAMSLTEWLPEISVLCIMLALLFITFAMKKRDFSKPAPEPDEQEIIDILMQNEEPAENGETEEKHEQADGKNQ